MNNKSAKQILNSYKTKRVLIALAYVAGLAVLCFVATKNLLLGVACIVVLAASIRAPFERLREKELEAVIYEDLDPVKFNELLDLGAFKKSTRHQALGAMFVGDYDRLMRIVEESDKKTMNPIEKCNNLYRRGAMYFELGEFEKLPAIVKEFNSLKKQNPKIEYVFNNFSVFDKFDAFADEDYEYVIDVCDIDLKENSPKKQNHKITRINVSFYRAVSLYKLGRLDEAREGFEDIIAFAPKMHKATISKKYLEMMK